MSSAAPFIVFFGVAGAVALACVAFWDRVLVWVAARVEPYRRLLERAAIPVKAEELAMMVIAAAIIPWGLLAALLKPSPLVGLVMLAGTSLVAFFGTRAYINYKVAKRLGQFNNQMELVLRLITGALRVGLGLRQALVTVVSDMPDPARIEFSRVLSQTQIGVGIHDALDQLAERMPSGEIAMMTRAIRIQSTTGGNLGKVLENIAETIKQRRKLNRKIAALTSEAKFTKYIITALPICVGAFLLVFEPDMRAGLLFTLIGNICLAVVVGLISVGWVVFGILSRLDI
ncbi:MAG TPA: type II secretion system F family protein [Candidatus Tyrphobacter sp.]